ncbi:undecaprenyl-diphosphate phosphatase [Pandoraea sp.]|uniref:undecaprenyl-diphosphate phosphatase n=1 Tax=Pandoraea sp. TaxID=1883445 RepID=UPI001203EFFB|nr:undecaprenyl-diphosphate phosphatase [Pandoraea sp.]MBU6492925.1 undecaprenyl-diphosphate phosphatase [Burkholderiales bacterium]MDE2288767.1 undecaprenyl-diphosphate phosphatase [Burkholderiales bacterium]MDE2608879.1 undecaprenyl-diphosphate phosphatase [Burkholderiales bacterium]TAL54262.1 MAG: undecaprenyl-diphosphate phosphatase [Pandoraea sp.]TAM17158.1 MAG: undecaprenyl-diphosphate phosphatase [Pandoraea sp.]
MTFLQILILAIVQGVCELLPVSSSAHVILAEKMMGLNPTAPQMTLFLVMLHTGTMFAVIVYFWKSWRERYFSSWPAFWRIVKQVVLATAFTGVIGLALMFLIERVILRGAKHSDVEQLFGNVYIIASGLAAAGIMIILSGKRQSYAPPQSLDNRASAWIGAIQGLCLPFRGFSRSGSTISMGLFLGIDKARLEEFSFALAVVLTPPVILREVYRLVKHSGSSLALNGTFYTLAWPSLVGMVFSFLAGLVALKWLSQWLEHGRWHLFGYYCLFASVAVLAINQVLH